MQHPTRHRSGFRREDEVACGFTRQRDHDGVAKGRGKPYYGEENVPMFVGDDLFPDQRWLDDSLGANSEMVGTSSAGKHWPEPPNRRVMPQLVRMCLVSLTQYYTATTLDGFIADSDNSLDWLFTREHDKDGLLNYGEFIARVGALAMGSTTYEWILDHEFSDKDPAEWKWPYDIPCWVFTHRQLPVVPDSGIEFTSEAIASVHEKMVAAAGERNVWIVGGGDLAGQFAEVGLLDEVIVSIAPVTLGAGAPLLPRRIELRLDELGRNGDLACARYSVVRQPA